MSETSKQHSAPDYSDPRIDLFRTLEGHIILEMDDPRKSIALAQLKSIEEQLAIVQGNFHDAEKARIGLLEQLDAVGDEAQAAHHRAEIAEIALEELREELGAQRKALRGLLFAAEKADVYPHKRAIVAQYETAKENAHRALSNPASEPKAS